MSWIKQQLDRNGVWLGLIAIGLAAALLGPHIHTISMILVFLGTVTIVALAYAWWLRKGPFFHPSKSRPK
jgi:hypothetical protein